jgi:hypothetical protein
MTVQLMLWVAVVVMVVGVQEGADHIIKELLLTHSVAAVQALQLRQYLRGALSAAADVLQVGNCCCFDRLVAHQSQRLCTLLLL